MKLADKLNESTSSGNSNMTNARGFFVKSVVCPTNDSEFNKNLNLTKLQ